ncbi:MAG: fructose-bisphosphate aldolase [Chloroflexota bacterium]|nr:MAG: fructose-bisphosphate aldolase [Chloroflexota bacterium]
MTNYNPMYYPNAGKTIRMGRIISPKDGRAAVVAYDHGLHVGTIPGNINPGQMLESLAEAGADAFLVAPGIARTYASIFAGRGAPGLILRLDWTDLWRDPSKLGYPEGRGCLIASVEDAARLGADAVLVYMFIGYENPEAEAQQVESVARVAQDCEALGIGCIIEPMARGLRVGDNPFNAEYIALASRMACELGADLLKTDYSGSAGSFRYVVESSFCPILIAGGPKTTTTREALEMVQGALEAGARGMFVGRNVFQAPQPPLMLKVMRQIIHDGISVDEALDTLGEKNRV